MINVQQNIRHSNIMSSNGNGNARLLLLPLQKACFSFRCREKVVVKKTWSQECARECINRTSKGLELKAILLMILAIVLFLRIVRKFIDPLFNPF